MRTILPTMIKHLAWMKSDSVPPLGFHSKINLLQSPPTIQTTRWSNLGHQYGLLSSQHLQPHQKLTRLLPWPRNGGWLEGLQNELDGDCFSCSLWRTIINLCSVGIIYWTVWIHFDLILDFITICFNKLCGTIRGSMNTIIIMKYTVGSCFLDKYGKEDFAFKLGVVIDNGLGGGPCN